MGKKESQSLHQPQVMKKQVFLILLTFSFWAFIVAEAQQLEDEQDEQLILLDYLSSLQAMQEQESPATYRAK